MIEKPEPAQLPNFLENERKLLEAVGFTGELSELLVHWTDPERTECRVFEAYEAAVETAKTASSHEPSVNLLAALLCRMEAEWGKPPMIHSAWRRPTRWEVVQNSSRSYAEERLLGAVWTAAIAQVGQILSPKGLWVTVGRLVGSVRSRFEVLHFLQGTAAPWSNKE